MRIVFLGNFAVHWSSETYWAHSLEDLGHEVTRLQVTQASAEEILARGRAADLLVWVHTPGGRTPGALGMEQVLAELRAAEIPTVSYHLDLWAPLPRAEQVGRDLIYRHIEHFFSVDPGLVDWFGRQTQVKGHYLPAGVYGGDCRMVERTPVDGGGFPHEVVFVGGRYNYPPQWPYRGELVDWLEGTYGERFTHFGVDGTAEVYGAALNQLYANTKIVVGDTLCPGFDYAGYWSDRIYETIGRGGFMIHPYIPGLEEQFTDGRHLKFYTYGDFGELRELIEHYLTHGEEREAIRRAGFEHVRDNHTYAHRWKAILEAVTGARAPSGGTEPAL
ncbi:glycosyltransferase [Streptomyces violaceusniger]|uniref:glycosyltransferase family protein n=1 Tax=Streptomyces violaceusniger TaxID=68280 RepID=UPI00142F3972|nr:glycosyltransferase [Streptomyces violaceusniger]